MSERKSTQRKPDEASLDYLYKAVMCLKTRDECADFFRDLCTTLELKSMSQRLLVAKMLTEENIYNDIVAATGASTATISRVNRTLNDERSGDGYRTVLERLEAEDGK
ncbi:MAG: YerC/YecD family TrpR-related protein [Oscillospiraceae bacterium]|nr:YerC/YecD family TrpR-related protein [Oscillospiraceae bacterium]